MKKCFVLDTNVLLHEAGSLFNFQDNDVVLPIKVIEELDSFKKESDERGRNARQVARDLDRLREKGSLVKGVQTENGGKVIVVLDAIGELPDCLSPDIADNRILASALYVKKKNKKMETIFVSKDINARVKADVVGLRSEDYETDKVKFEELWTGWTLLECSDSQISEFDASGMLAVEKQLVANEFVILKTDKEKRHAKYCIKRNRIVPLEFSRFAPWGIRPMNDQQIFAMEALLDEKIRLVSLVGKAGTGKTLLALAAGLKKCVDDISYKKILVSRPIMPMGKDIGYLPGSKDEKLSHWMGPIFDNLNYIFDNYITDTLPSEQLAIFMKNEKICLEALTYIRGRSIANQWLIIDESQNLTPHEVKTIISRAGSGTKIVLTGDPYQIDNPYLDPSSNGLSYLVEKFKGQEIFGNLILHRSERSTLASLAADLL